MVLGAVDWPMFLFSLGFSDVYMIWTVLYFRPCADYTVRAPITQVKLFFIVNNFILVDC